MPVQSNRYEAPPVLPNPHEEKMVGSKGPSFDRKMIGTRSREVKMV